MSETEAAASTEPADQTAETATEEPKPEVDWKAKAREWERRAKANADAASRLAAFEESQKTEAQKLADRATQAEKERDEARLDVLRVKVGAARKLPSDVVDLLKGDTEEELAAHAERLAEHFKQSARPSGSVDQGRRGEAIPLTPAQELASFLQTQLRQ